MDAAGDARRGLFDEIEVKHIEVRTACGSGRFNVLISDKRR
jgi:hypothetical protein